MRFTAVLTLSFGIGASGIADAACNLIPSASSSFRSTLGSTNKPYAAPGDYVEVSVRPGGCDVTSPGLGALASDHVVTVVFTPSQNGTRRVAFLIAGSCPAPDAVDPINDKIDA